MKRLNLDLDDEVFSEFKAHCARKGVTMREEVIKLVSSALEPEEKEVSDESKDMILRPFLSKGSEELEVEREQRSTSKAALILAGRATDTRFDNIDRRFRDLEFKQESEKSYLRNYIDQEISSLTAYINNKTHHAEIKIRELQDTNDKIREEFRELKQKVQNIEEYLAKRDHLF